MKKRIVAIVLMMVFAAAVFAGCSAAPQPSPSTSASESAPASSAAPSSSESASVSESASASASPSESPSESKAASPILDAIKAKGKLVIGCEAQYPPFEYHKLVDGKDEIVGSDIELAKEIAKQLGVTLDTPKDLPFDTLITALNTNKIDMVISAMEPREDRKESADFSDAYYDAGSSVIVRKGEETTFTTIESLKGKKVGAQLGSTQETMVKDQMKDSTPVTQEKIPDMGLALKSKKLDALVVDTLVAENYVKANPELVLSPIKLQNITPGYAIALNKGDAVLVAQLNDIIKGLRDSGKMQEFIDKANADSAAE